MPDSPGDYTGIVLSGGPSSVYEDEAPLPDKRLLESGLPLLGIRMPGTPAVAEVPVVIGGPSSRRWRLFLLALS